MAEQRSLIIQFRGRSSEFGSNPRISVPINRAKEFIHEQNRKGLEVISSFTSGFRQKAEDLGAIDISERFLRAGDLIPSVEEQKKLAIENQLGMSFGTLQQAESQLAFSKQQLKDTSKTSPFRTQQAQAIFEAKTPQEKLSVAVAQGTPTQLKKIGEQRLLETPIQISVPPPRKDITAKRFVPADKGIFGTGLGAKPGLIDVPIQDLPIEVAPPGFEFKPFDSTGLISETKVTKFQEFKQKGFDISPAVLPATLFTLSFTRTLLHTPKAVAQLILDPKKAIIQGSEDLVLKIKAQEKGLDPIFAGELTALFVTPKLIKTTFKGIGFVSKKIFKPTRLIEIDPRTIARKVDASLKLPDEASIIKESSLTKFDTFADVTITEKGLLRKTVIKKGVVKIKGKQIELLIKDIIKKTDKAGEVEFIKVSEKGLINIDKQLGKLLFKKGKKFKSQFEFEADFGKKIEGKGMEIVNKLEKQQIKDLGKIKVLQEEIGSRFEGIAEIQEFTKRAFRKDPITRIKTKGLIGDPVKLPTIVIDESLVLKGGVTFDILSTSQRAGKFRELAISPGKVAFFDKVTPKVDTFLKKVLRDNSKSILNIKKLDDITPDIRLKAIQRIKQKNIANIIRNAERNAQVLVNKQKVVTEHALSSKPILTPDTIQSIVDVTVKGFGKTKPSILETGITNILKNQAKITAGITAGTITRQKVREKILQKAKQKLKLREKQKTITSQTGALIQDVSQKLEEGILQAQAVAQKQAQKQKQALQQSLKLALKTAEPSVVVTPFVPTTPTIFIPPDDTIFKDIVEKRRKKKKIKELLTFTPGFTAKILGLKPRTLSKKQIKQLLHSKFTGFGIRRPVILKGVMD